MQKGTTTGRLVVRGASSPQMGLCEESCRRLEPPPRSPTSDQSQRSHVSFIQKQRLPARPRESKSNAPAPTVCELGFQALLRPTRTAENGQGSAQTSPKGNAQKATKGKTRPLTSAKGEDHSLIPQPTRMQSCGAQPQLTRSQDNSHAQGSGSRP